MTQPFDFSQIAPYQDHEVKGVLEELKQDISFIHLLQFMQMETTPVALDALFDGIDSVAEFQRRISKPWLSRFIEQTTTAVSHEGIDTMETHRKFLFVSNHRDIVMDSALLNVLLHSHGLPTVETAIGDNLLKFPIVKKLTKLNKNFTVVRSAGAREMYFHSQVLSAYIRKKIVRNESSIWIAQREGRAKDGNDQTQQGVIKMLNLSNEKDFETGCRALNIRPMSLSYEYDPCDRFKIKELLTRETGQCYEKEEEEDFKNIIAGFLGDKGRIHLSLQPVLNADIDQIKAIPTLNEKIGKLAELIDRSIYRGYRLFENNFIAHDLLQGAERWRERYTPEMKRAFAAYADEVCRDLPPAAKTLLFRKYAYPLINKLAAVGSAVG